MSGHHALIAPSSMDRTVACSAWIGLSQGLPPEPETEEAMEGNAADWVAKQWAQGIEWHHGAPIPLPGDFKVDYDMIHGAKMWTKTLGYGAVSGVPVICERIHPTDCWGEPDGWRWDAIEGVLRLPDYKYGFEIVDVFENWQLIPYAVGLIDTLGLKDTEVTIEFIIVQPRAHHLDGPVRRWKVRADKIRHLVTKAHHAAIRAVPPPNLEIAPPLAVTGPHCVHCPARLHCKSFQMGISTVLSTTRSATRVAMDHIAVGTQLALVQDAIKMLKAQETALEAQAESYIRSGKHVPNFVMEPGTSRLGWLPNVTAEEIILLAHNVAAIDARKPPGALNSRSGPIVTPTQLIKAGVDAAVISQYADRPKGAMKLARESSSTIRRIFGDDNT